MTRTSIPVDEELIEQAMRLTGARTPREAVETALRRLVATGSLHRALRGTKGRLAWNGSLDAWRRARS